MRVGTQSKEAAASTLPIVLTDIGFSCSISILTGVCEADEPTVLSRRRREEEAAGVEDDTEEEEAGVKSNDAALERD